jgi:hypothetical protein
VRLNSAEEVPCVSSRFGRRGKACPTLVAGALCHLQTQVSLNNDLLLLLDIEHGLKWSA